jgi:CBS domain-containing protein
MLVKDVMTGTPVTIGPAATQQVAARMMREGAIGALVVCDAGRPLGVVTDRDIVVRGVAEGDDPILAEVRAVMTPQVVHCCIDDDLDEAARKMAAHAVRRMVVVDSAEKPVGVLSVDDVALHDPALAGEIIESARVPERPSRRFPWPW